MDLEKKLKSILRSYGHTYYKTVVFHKDDGKMEFWFEKLDQETIPKLHIGPDAKIEENLMWREWITVRGLEPITIQQIDDRIKELKENT